MSRDFLPDQFEDVAHRVEDRVQNVAHRVEDQVDDVVAQARSSRAGRFAQAAYALWARHPSWSMALKGAVAASLAWVVGTLAPAPFSEYPYYAPLGAVVATTGTLVWSARVSAQATAAIVLGAVVARTVDFVLDPGAPGVAVVVFVALVLSGWRRLGDMGGWVVTSALFVLILGQGHAAEFIGSYAGLVAVGGAIGVGVNLLFPPLPLTPSEVALDKLRDVLVDQLDLLADGLDRERAPSQDEWADRMREIGPVLDRAQRAIARSREAIRANHRVRRYRYRDWAPALLRRAEVLTTVADVVGETTTLAAEWEHRDREELAFGARLRPPAARTMRALADTLRSHGLDGADREKLDAFEAAVAHLRAEVHEARQEDSHDYFVAGAVLVALRRACSALSL